MPVPGAAGQGRPPDGTARPSESGLSAPLTAVPDDGRGTTEPVIALDLALSGKPAVAALDVAGTPEGGAAVLVGQPPSGRGPGIVLVSADGRRAGSLAVPGLTSAWDLHVLPDDTALGTRPLAEE